MSAFGFRFAEGYGLTETVAPSHSNPPDALKQQYLGISFMSVESRVVDPDTLAEMLVGEAGEIIMRGGLRCSPASGNGRRPPRQRL